MSKEFAPLFRTPEEQLSKEEKNKLASNGMLGNVGQDFEDSARDDVPWETEQLAKSYGIYLEFNRAKTGREKDWMYMIRIGVPGGGPINRNQWQALDDLASRFTVGPNVDASLRLTTRQNIQFHWVKKENLKELVRVSAESGLLALNGCGDNTRNVMACPLSRYSKEFDANLWAQRTAKYFLLPEEPFIQIFEIDPSFLRTDQTDGRFSYGKNLLNRKFKIAFSAANRDAETGKLVADNCVELRTNDLGIAPIISGDKIDGFQVYIGGGQGERHGKATAAMLAKPLCVSTEEQLLAVLDAIVAVHQEWGDRKNRHWARLKYVVHAKGTDWYRERVEERLGTKLSSPIEDFDPGPRFLHHGWTKQENNGLMAYGVYIENGRLIDSTPNGKLKSMVRDTLDEFDCEALITPNQDLLFCNIAQEAQGDFEAKLQSYGYGKRNGKAISPLRLRSGACVGRDTCRLTYTDSEKFEPELLDQLEKMGWGEMTESIGITGCERQCFRPSTKTIGLVGSGLNRYQLRLLGSEDARHQGQPLYSEDGKQVYLRSIPRERVAQVIDSLFRFYRENAQSDEPMGYFHRRVGIPAILEFLRTNEATSDLLEETHDVKARI